MSKEPFIRTLTLRNFRSIRKETVIFTNPLFLVGKNGSGKSNFVDALSFIADCMTTPLQTVVEQWGGAGRIGNLHAPREFPYISFRLEFFLEAQHQQGFYDLRLRVSEDENLIVNHEECRVDGNSGSINFIRTEDSFTSTLADMRPVLEPQTLAMFILGGMQELSSLNHSLAAMKVYNIKPEQIGSIQELSSAPFLKRDASNSNSILLRLASRDKDSLMPNHISRIDQLLQSIVPGVFLHVPEILGSKSFLYVDQQTQNIKSVYEASAMSSGTLSTLGVIIAALQEPPPALIAIEEPERNIYPGALEAIAGIIDIASQRTQIMITTHSPELLDTPWITSANLRVVNWENGITHISELGEAPIRALQLHLMGVGELMRANALDAAPWLHSEEEEYSGILDKDLI